MRKNKDINQSGTEQGNATFLRPSVSTRETQDKQREEKKSQTLNRCLKTKKCTIGDLSCKGKKINKLIDVASVPCGRAAEVWRTPKQNIAESLLMFILIGSRKFHFILLLMIYIHTVPFETQMQACLVKLPTQRCYI